MIFFAPVYTSTLTAAKRFGRPLLAVPLCVLLMSCDSASSNTDNEGMISKVALADDIKASEVENSQNSDNNQSKTEDESDKVVEAQSLIAAAQSNRDTTTTLLSTDSEPQRSMLQATLIGDYIGMVSCISCDSVSIALNLFADGSVLKTSIYNNPEQSRAPLIESGIYRQDDEKITIVYEAKNIETYQIQDNHLILIDDDDTLDDDYTLSRK